MFFHLLGVSFVLHFSLSLGTNKQGCCSLWDFFGTLFYSIVLQGWCNNLLPFFFNRNGRWRSEWSVSFQPSGGSVEVTGVLKVQVKETDTTLQPQTIVFDGYISVLLSYELKFVKL